MYGGRDGTSKAWRRYGASLASSAAIWLSFILTHHWQWWLLLLYPLTIAQYCMGYGADAFWMKVFKRGYIALFSIMLGGGLAYLSGNWAILLIDIVLTLTTIYVGVRNPTKASPEEFLIGFVVTFPKILYPLN